MGEDGEGVAAKGAISEDVDEMIGKVAHSILF
jgi:hypothetical protein